MYKHILIPLENSATDRAILDHIKPLVKMIGTKVLLLHVADGWVARNFNQLKLAESEEMKADRGYLESNANRLRSEGLRVSARLALGDPPAEILKTAELEACDLIAMTTHGHRLLGDLLFGSTIHEVRHRSSIPILLVRAARKGGRP